MCIFDPIDGVCHENKDVRGVCARCCSSTDHEDITFIGGVPLSWTNRQGDYFSNIGLATFDSDSDLFARRGN